MTIRGEGRTERRFQGSSCWPKIDYPLKNKREDSNGENIYIYKEHVKKSKSEQDDEVRRDYKTTKLIKKKSLPE